jgi:hypothetical protein
MNVQSTLPRLAIGAVLALTLGVAPTATAAASAAAPGPAPTTTVKAQATQAKQALAQAVAQVKAGNTSGAKTSLGAVRTHTAAANTAARNLIGKPPTDPESDDPPGPPAVTAALKLDATVVTGVAALYNGTTAPALVKAISTTLSGVQAPRNTMVNKVVGLPPEGAGADYSDGLSDLLPLFKKEVKTLTTDVGAFQLTAGAKTGLNAALTTSKATQKVFVKAYGGGERPAGA